ncbi:MAG: STAS domain-containing protein [Treponema sp.]|nr:STAS domain-containing protein [Treponema sp.]
MEQLTVTKKDGNNYTEYELAGAFNAYTAPTVQNKIYKSIAKMNVVLDLSKVEELDSAGMGVIMAAHNDAEEFNTKLYLLSPSNEVENELLETGFRDLFRIITSVTEAVL